MFALFFLSLSCVLLVPIHFSLRRISSLELFFFFLSSLSFYFSLFHSFFIVQQHLSFPIFVLLYIFHTFDVRYFVIFYCILFFALNIQSFSFVIHFSSFPVLRSFTILRYPFLCAKKLLLSSISSNIAR